MVRKVTLIALLICGLTCRDELPFLLQIIARGSCGDASKYSRGEVAVALDGASEAIDASPPTPGEMPPPDNDSPNYLVPDIDPEVEETQSPCNPPPCRGIRGRAYPHERLVCTSTPFVSFYTFKHLRI